MNFEADSDLEVVADLQYDRLPLRLALRSDVRNIVDALLSSLTQNRIARVLFCVDQGKMVLLHGFIKKTQQTPENDLDLAVKRQKEVEGGKAAK